MHNIPNYSLYGNWADGKEEWFVSIEPLAKRCHEKGWTIDPHVHPNFGQLFIITKGSGTCSIEEQHLKIVSPCAFVVPMQSVHSFVYQENTDGLVITIENAYLEQISNRLAEFNLLWNYPTVINLSRDSAHIQAINNAILRLKEELETRDIGHWVATEAHLTSIFLYLLRAGKSSPEAPEGASATQLKLVRTFRNLIESAYREDWKIGDYTAKLNVSNSQLRAACEKVCGKSPIKLVHERKLTEAKRNLIFSELNVEQIAYNLSFSSPSYFARFFKNEMGTTPAEFRAQGRGISTRKTTHTQSTNV